MAEKFKRSGQRSDSFAGKDLMLRKLIFLSNNGKTEAQSFRTLIIVQEAFREGADILNV
jgi:hypothetical protein